MAKLLIPVIQADYAILWTHASGDGNYDIECPELAARWQALQEAMPRLPCPDCQALDSHVVRQWDDRDDTYMQLWCWRCMAHWRQTAAGISDFKPATLQKPLLDIFGEA